MACCLASFIIVAVIIYYIIKFISRKTPSPKLENKWWGKGKPGDEDKSIKPFKIEVSEDVIKDLKDRLNRTRLVAPLEGIQHQYGINTDLLKEILEYWKDKYDWKSREVFLNQFPQFTTNIQGLNIHYIHVKPTNTEGLKVLPLMLCHGWPGSTREFYEIIPKLTTRQPSRDFVFEVIVPSLPGYGFSEAAVRPGLSVTYIAEILKNLMERIGFDKYYVQGGDWGSFVVQHMAILFPEKIYGLHCNLCILNTLKVNLKLLFFSLYPRFIIDEKHEHLVYPLSKKFKGMLEESGYFHIQATKPDTVGVGVNDSPAGLAAYTLEKFIAGTKLANKNKLDGGLKEKFTYDQLLDNVMIYWITNCFPSSVRLYAENMTTVQRSLKMESKPISVPAGYVRFANEIMYLPDTIAKEKFHNLVHLSDYDDVGHFAALEAPDILAKDIFDAVSKMENFHRNTVI